MQFYHIRAVRSGLPRSNSSRLIHRLIVAAMVIGIAGPALTQSPCINGMANGLGCANVDLMSVRTPAELGVGGTSKWISDCWGWVDPLTLKEYALIGLKDGTAFMDITDPVNPIRIGTLPTHSFTSTWRDIKVYADHAFIVSEASGHGMQVFDLTRLRNVAAPPIVFTEDAHTGLFGNAHNLVIDEASAHAYVVGSNQCSGGLYIYDIQTPTTPTLVGCYDLSGYIHDAQCVTYTGPDPDHQGSLVCFNCHSGTDKLTIVDVSDPSDVELISQAVWPNARIGHQGWLTEDQRYFLLGDEGDEGFYGFNTRTLVFDVTDLDNPVLVGAHLGTKASTDHNMYTHQGLIYQANYSSGLQVLDTTDLANASFTEVGWFDTYPTGNASGYDGAWSVYPYFPSGNVVISDFDFGMYVVRPHAFALVKVMLDGPFDVNTGLMNDGLRIASLIPILEPYTALGYTHVGGGGETVDPSVFSVTGPDAIVDWVVLELRDMLDPTQIMATRACLVQRDGDVVDVDGTSKVRFDVAGGSYRLSVRHRNHLGVMTDGAARIGLAPHLVDLTLAATETFGTNARKSLGGVLLMWAGNANGDDLIKYAGSQNDREVILTTIGGSVPTNSVAGYRIEDVSMDGVTKYAGPGNDRDRVLQNIGGSVPTATRSEQLP